MNSDQVHYYKATYPVLHDAGVGAVIPVNPGECKSNSMDVNS